MGATTVEPTLGDGALSAPAEVFISYSSKDDALAKRVRESLAGISCFWAPENIRSGLWPSKIAEAIRNCRVVVLILSPSSNLSRQVWREIAIADTHERRVLVFQTEKLKLSDYLEYFLGGTQIQFAFPGDLSTHCAELLSRVRGELGMPVPESPAKPRISAFIKWNAVAIGLLFVCLAIWLQRYTNTGLVSYAPFGALPLIPLALYQLLPFLHPAALSWATNLAITPGRTAKFAMAGVTGAFACLLAATLFVGTISVTWSPDVNRWVTFNGGPRLYPKAGNAHKELFRAHWRTHQPIAVQAQGLGDPLRLNSIPWCSQVVKVPESFIKTPMLLVIPDEILQGMPDREFYLRAHIDRASGPLDPKPVKLSPDGKSVTPFWIGCSGSFEVLTAEISGVEPRWGKGPFPCRIWQELRLKDAITLIVQSENSRTVRACEPLPITVKPGETAGQLGKVIGVGTGC